MVGEEVSDIGGDPSAEPLFEGGVARRDDKLSDGRMRDTSSFSSLDDALESRFPSFATEISGLSMEGEGEPADDDSDAVVLVVEPGVDRSDEPVERELTDP